MLLLLMLQYLQVRMLLLEPPLLLLLLEARVPVRCSALLLPPPATVACIRFKGTTWSPNAPSVIAIIASVENGVVVAEHKYCVRSNTL